MDAIVAAFSADYLSLKEVPLGFALRLVWQFLVIQVVATFAFDIVHYFLHLFADSEVKLLKRIGALHDAHHRFYDESLNINEEWTQKNALWHLLPEAATQVLVTGVFFVFFSPIVVSLALVYGVVRALVVVVSKGRDPNHYESDRIKTPASWIFVTPNYHLMHHRYPRHFISSFHTLFDKLFGTALQLKGRRFVVTGANGAYGKAMCARLEKSGAIIVKKLAFNKDWNYDDYSKADDALKACDVLLLAHGSKLDQAMQANNDSFCAFIDRYVQHYYANVDENEVMPPEVWAVGSEIECHPAFFNDELQVYKDSKMAYAKNAWRYYHRSDLLYRHIVPSAFRSKMGWAPLSAQWAAGMSLFYLKRGYRYVPVTYTGIAFVNYFKFMAAPWFNKHKSPKEENRNEMSQAA